MKKFTQKYFLMMADIYDRAYRGGVGRGLIDEELAKFFALCVNKKMNKRQADRYWQNDIDKRFEKDMEAENDET